MWKLEPHYGGVEKMCARELDKVCAELEIKDLDKAALWEAMRASYSDGDDFYHTWSHIAHCLNTWSEARHMWQWQWQMQTLDEPRGRLALLLHDAGESPETIANYVRECGAGPFVAELIRDTAHTSLPRSDIGRLLCDVDLYILAETPAIFDRYCARVVNEWRGRVTYQQYAQARIQILEAFARRGVFNTEWFRKHMSLKAGYNINREIARLQKSLSPVWVGL